MTSITEKAPLDVKQLQAIAKELKVPGWSKAKRDELVMGIAAAKGWADEKIEVIEFLLQGGQIEELPGFVGIAPKKNNRETSAGGKVEPTPEPAKKSPRKVSQKSETRRANGQPRKQPSTGDTVTIQEICEELGVEGRIARRKLRGSDIAKPGDSWTWSTGHADIEKVRALLK